MFQMFKRNARNNCNEISDAEANIIASRKLKFWRRRIACAMAKTKAKAMCIINRTNKYDQYCILCNLKIKKTTKYQKK
jgi:hypothetical protein